MPARGFARAALDCDSSSLMDLSVLLGKDIDLPRVAEVLDGLGHEARVWATRQWTRDIQSRVYEAAKGFKKVTLDSYVPAGTGDLVEVRHHGTNTLPMHNVFEKRFAKPKGASDQLVGFNYQSWSGITGPGYFVTHLATDENEVDIDYTMVPKEKVETWPPILPNEARLGRFVYAGMVDVMRGISEHVSIGRARKKHGYMDAWFVLVRQDLAS
jgi:hypothetical protein